GGITGEARDFGGTHAALVAFDAHRDSSEADQDLDDVRHRHRLASGDVVRAARHRTVEEKPVRAADVAYVEEVALGREVTDAERTAALGFQPRDLARPRADRKPVVAPGALVVRRPRDHHVEPGDPARELRGRLARRV